MSVNCLKLNKDICGYVDIYIFMEIKILTTVLFSKASMKIMLKGRKEGKERKCYLRQNYF